MKPQNSSINKFTAQNTPIKKISYDLNKLIRKDAASMFLNVAMILPANSGKVFDFNATLPIMAAQFILLVVFLDKTWFGPVGEILDARDELIRNRLMSVKSGNDDLEASRSSTQKDIERQVAGLAEYIVATVLPSG